MAPGHVVKKGRVRKASGVLAAARMSSTKAKTSATKGKTAKKPAATKGKTAKKASAAVSKTAGKPKATKTTKSAVKKAVQSKKPKAVQSKKSETTQSKKPKADPPAETTAPDAVPAPPKRPHSSYILFTQKIRPTIQEENPGAGPQEIMKLAGERWAALPENDRQPFVEEAGKLMEAYRAEIAAYREQYPGASLKRKRKRRVQLPTPPKKARTAYVFFTQSNGAKLLNEDPSVDFAQRSSKSAALWQEMSDEEKVPYEELAKQDRERYEKEIAEFNAANPKFVFRQKFLKKHRPKKALAAYLFFTKEVRAEMKDSDTDVNFGDGTKVIAERWKKLTPSRKAVYETLAAKDAERYEREMKEYVKPTEEEIEAAWQASRKRKRGAAGSESAEPKPKRPATGFQLFAAEARADLKETQPDLSFGQIQGEIAKRWKALGDDQEAYRAKAKAAAANA